MATLTSQQRRAIDPNATIWVTASAGSGKTKVLTDRLLALMVSGTPPDRLLCLTFTKAAAAEMANRLQARLSAWGLISEECLKQEIEGLGLFPSNELRMRARGLFTKLLDTPGGFKIQTLHGFCQSLLSRFPLEAGLSPHFSVLDEIQAQTLLGQAQDDIFRKADEGSDPELTQALTCLTQTFSEYTLRPLITDYVKEGPSLRPFCETPEKEAQTLKQMTDFLHITTEKDCHETLWSCPLERQEKLQQLSVCLRDGNAEDQKNGGILAAWLASPSEETFKNYQVLFITSSGSPRKRLISSKLSARFPSFVPLLEAEQERLLELRDFLQRQHVFEISAALLKVALAIQKRYQELKTEKAVLDYDDLITGAIRLLNSPQGALWVLYKLDSGLDHVLIDEAQDTSPEQWQVIQGLADAFFETPETSKTLFVVGDPKQSIYSFQGADPAAFSFMQRYVKQRVQSLRRPFWEVSLDTSFRSSSVVLQAIDQVFQRGSVLSGVASEALAHKASQIHLQGQVEVWPLVDLPPPPVRTWEEGERDETPSPSPQTLLAQGIARQIKGWLEAGESLTKAALRPGDILILVRRRGRLMQALVKALKELQVPVAGVDRMSLNTSLAVADLLKLAEFCLLPGDDLTLAVVLKGPLIRLSEEKLFELAYKRGEISLWHRLKMFVAAGSPFQEAYHFLESLIPQALNLSPFGFFSYLLNACVGRQKMLERLGVDAGDALNELLSLSLAYEQNNPPVLQNFLGWMARNEIQIKRDLEHGSRDEVRILTVHGSKGLEAPVVILPDTVRPPRDLPSLLWVQGPEDLFPCWTPPEAQTPRCLRPFKAKEAQKQQEEYNRLLYVALTRASERLYICGWKGETALSSASWYAHIYGALKPETAVIPFSFCSGVSDWEGEGLRLSSLQLSPQKTPEKPEDSIRAGLPSWILQAPPLEQMPMTLSPAGQIRDADSPSLRRGIAIHLLLEKLVSVPDDLREQEGTRLLSHLEGGHALVDTCLQEALQLLRQPELAWLWSSEGLSEVSLRGQDQGRVISGRIDRLIVTPERVIIIDFKTDSVPPSLLPEPYEHQLNLYRSALSSLYTQSISCGILWTATGRITWAGGP